ncbi:hypothetical protein, partial [Naasia sp.]|uniref:hypothetical protein n=1 Tax=Naasia sp. TaxID=2546198 RepID=UPI002604AF42
MLSRSMPVGRSIIRIIVPHMSAQLAQSAAQVPMPSMPDIESEHIVQACMQAEHASMQFCIAVMSMPDITEVSDMGRSFIMSLETLIVALRSAPSAALDSAGETTAPAPETT